MCGSGELALVIPASATRKEKEKVVHYNVQITVQQVGVVTDRPTTALHRGHSPVAEARRRTIEVLSLKVVARTEEEAYAKAKTMLEAATPKEPGEGIDPGPGGDEDDEDEI